MIDVRRLDQDDESQLRGYWEVGAACTAELPYDPWPTWESARRSWTVANPEREMSFWGVLDGGRMVGGALVGVPLLDNTHLLHFELYVEPGSRRAGVGSALLRAAEAWGAERGRTTYVSGCVEPVGASTVPGLEFAAAHGYARASTEECKVVDLVEHEPDLAALGARAAERMAGYRLETWLGHAPETWLDQMCVLYSSFLDEVPLEDLDLEAQTWTPARFRAAEERRLAAGLCGLTVAAVAPDGTLAGYANLWVPEDAPDRAAIDSTLVLPAHRGHRLGLGLKVRLHQETRATFPDARTIVTYNAGVNAHMNAVNAELGYQVRQLGVGLQKKV